MPHKAIGSFDSQSPLLSLSSEASVELYQKSIKPKTDIITNSRTTLQELVNAAEAIVNGKFASDSRRNFTFTKDKKQASANVELDKVMLAMLAFAEDCGGESGKRYVAAAICSCSRVEDELGALAALGITWVTHLLFVFKTRCGHSRMDRAPQGPFTEDVIKRDGYKCILTGYQARTHPNPVSGLQKVILAAPHILVKTVGQFDNNHNSASYKAAVTTFDILVNFTRLPVKTLEELSAKLDNPSNGITLEFNAHAAFDAFEWCLKKTDLEDVYNLKIFSDGLILNKPKTSRITFTDHSSDFSDSTGNLTRKAPVDLPNAHYIEIHAAIAGILHMSGAGKFFDKLFDTYREDEDKVSAVRCWPELEKLIEGQLLKDSIEELFQSARVH